jgi:hypothetical protein
MVAQGTIIMPDAKMYQKSLRSAATKKRFSAMCQHPPHAMCLESAGHVTGAAGKSHKGKNPKARSNTFAM